MALGKNNGTSAAITTNATTTLVTPGARERVYVYWIGVDTSVAGTTSTAQVNDSTGAVQVGLYNTTAVGHQESFTEFGQRDYPGFALPVGAALQVVTAGGAAATLTVSFVYEIKG